MCSNGPGYMTKMTAIPISVKNLKIFFSGTKIPMTLKLGMQHWISSTTKFIQMMTLGSPWPILRQGKIWSLMLLYGKRERKDFSETIVVCYIKVGRCC